ncbi:MAG: Type 1 glutamine amidotransferase-like domain-containing protein [Gomphosphaeria aponina SAG 52.96 = DSM 107014]|uniref:Type 1 glutamine amidotransferase-like domain-containing protein n=1 Tax=Gomphosphaeria aponina SAG 52.96 = DSM 107014 TaxID=1521640 RepID=A0A941GUT3_9CHRO|nr:Type 1 glutamine amidotransferase-like domain-containing protein [Gomphosphaeria aponina SAG 52.96 = DSM 107014]
MGGRNDFDYYVACESDRPKNCQPQGGVLLIGGAEGEKSGENEATRWFLERAKNGKYLVLRTGRIGGQADWVCKYYGDYIHSAAELAINSSQAANNSRVIDYLQDADALFIAGGDQNEYQELWEDTDVEDTINYLVNEKKTPIAGTSAGMAILGDYYYAPDHQGVLSSEILNDPYHFNTETIHKSNFLKIPFLERVITDTHLDRINSQNPETRYGRALGLLARVVNENGLNNYALCLEEGAFVAIDENGKAQVFGNGTKTGQDAYFLQTNGALPEQILPGWPLVWDNEGKAVKVYSIPGDRHGSGYFNLNNWQDAHGGKWEYWFTFGGKSGLRKRIID